MITSVCKAKKYEWRNGELFLVSDSVSKDTAWVDSFTMEQVRAESPFAASDRNNPSVFIIQRLLSGDRVFEVTDTVTFSGGDVLCFIKPVGNLH